MHKLLAIIDDDPEMGELYHLILEPLIEEGILDLRIFCDGKTFLEWLNDQSPDLVLSDVNLPDQTGPEVIEQMRLRGHHMPVLLISGFDARDYETIMDKLAISRFLSKPLDFQELITIIEDEIGTQNSLT